MGLNVSLTVIPVQGWRRAMPWSDTGLPWIPPSPNIPSLDAVYAFACAGIIEATTLSEGRGTCKPFEYIGAPDLDAARVVADLNERRLPGVLFREVYFQPAFRKYAGQVCAGMHIMFSDHARVEPLRTMFTLLQVLARRHPGGFNLHGGFRTWLDGGAWTPSRLAELDIESNVAEARAQGEQFGHQIEDCLLYPTR